MFFCLIALGVGNFSTTIFWGKKFFLVNGGEEDLVQKDFQTHVLLVGEKFKIESFKLKIRNMQLLF